MLKSEILIFAKDTFYAAFVNNCSISYGVVKYVPCKSWKYIKTDRTLLHPSDTMWHYDAPRVRSTLWRNTEMLSLQYFLKFLISQCYYSVEFGCALYIQMVEAGCSRKILLSLILHIGKFIGLGFWVFWRTSIENKKIVFMLFFYVINMKR